MKRVAEIDQIAAAPEFWNDQQKAQTLLKEQAQKRDVAESWDKQRRALDDALVLLDLAEEAGDEASAKEAEAMVAAVESGVGKMKFAKMLSGENDRANALVSINAGAGGVDAQDWAAMLLRMLLRYCERKGWKVEVIDEQFGEEAGIKSATFIVSGDTETAANEVCRRALASNGEMRTSRCTPFSAFRYP